MMPGANLFFPQTLSKPPDNTEDDTKKQRYRPRKASEDSASDGKSITPSRRSTENVTRLVFALPTAFAFADWVSKQAKVSTDSEVFSDLLQRVRHDVTEASRLYTSQAVTEYLDSWPDKKLYIDRILLDVEKVINDISLFLETARASEEDGVAVSLRRKFQWALSHQKRLIGKQQLLSTCHQSLMPAIQLMQAVEMNATLDPIHKSPTQTWAEGTTSKAFMSPHSKQERKLYQRASSVPSIAISETDPKNNNIVMQNKHRLAELPGSTPEDLQRHNMGFFVRPSRQRTRFMDEGLGVRENQDFVQSSSREGASNVSKEQTRADTDLAAASRGISSDPPSMQRSFDHGRPLLSFVDGRAHASFDAARPRAYSEQPRVRRSFELRSRPSYDQVHTLPTLTERPIERFNSTASIAVGDAISLPLASMRYRSKPVQVRKLPTKHNSVPSILPSFPSQTSLMDDLSTWLVPQSARDGYHSVYSDDTVASIGGTTPPTSATSSPIMTKTSASNTSVLLNSSPTEAVTILDSLELATVMAFQDESLRVPPVVKPSPALPSRPAPAPPPSSLPPSVATYLSSETSSPPVAQPEDIMISTFHDGLRRVPSDPIPPPFVRRRKPISAPRKRPLNGDISKASSEALSAAPVVLAPLTTVAPANESIAIEAATSNFPAQVESTSAESLPGTDYQHNLHHSASSTSAMEGSEVDIVRTNISGASYLPRSSMSTSPDSISYTELKQSIHHASSNATTTDKYPIALALEGAPSIPVISMQSPAFAKGGRSTIGSFHDVQGSLPRFSPPSRKQSSQTLPNETDSVPPVAQPMTAQAKRRAAHAKRMETAFGGDSKNA